MAQTRPSPTLSRGFTRLGRFLAPYGVTSPRWTSARSYSRQFPTRYVVLYFGYTFDFISRIVRWPRPQDQPVDDARRSKGQEPCTKAG